MRVKFIIKQLAVIIYKLLVSYLTVDYNWTEYVRRTLITVVMNGNPVLSEIAETMNSPAAHTTPSTLYHDTEGDLNTAAQHETRTNFPLFI